VRRRFDWETRDLRSTYAGILWAAERWFRKDPVVLAKIRAVRADHRLAFGWQTRLWGALVGPVLLTTLWLEERRLRRGWTYEPTTFYETNTPVSDAGRTGRPLPSQCRWVEPRIVPESETKTA
jgi:hypothetical protein